MIRYLALGDSISIDTYTKVAGGGAASQLAARLGVRPEYFWNLARDGHTTERVLADLAVLRKRPDVVTLTVGGNDFLEGRPPAAIAADLERIAARLAPIGGAVVMNTVYDPTDGDDDLLRQLGVSADSRRAYAEINESLRRLAGRYGFLIADLQVLFAGHGIASREPWVVLEIEPNHAGASAIARHWFELIWPNVSASRRQVLIEGHTPEEILALVDGVSPALVLTGEPLVFRAGSAEILGGFHARDGRLVVELAHIDGGGEGVLPALGSLAERYAARSGLNEVEWVVHAVNCANPNLKLRSLLELRGFVIEDVPGHGTVYHCRRPARPA